MSAGDSVFLVAAGVVAGVLGTSGAITSLVSYPALLAIGIPARTANITNAIALIASWPGSALGSRPELAGQAHWLRRWSVLMAAGGLAGGLLLLLTPAHAFARVVPFLIVLAAVVLLLQPRISSWRVSNPMRYDHLVFPVGLTLVAIYDGYFGGGSGVMTLALLLLTHELTLQRANALKNLLLGASDVMAGILFAIFGTVRWEAAGWLGLGAFVGSTIGPAIARRLPTAVIRTLVACAAFALAIKLWSDPS